MGSVVKMAVKVLKKTAFPLFLLPLGQNFMNLKTINN